MENESTQGVVRATDGIVTSDSLKNIAEALAKFQGTVESISKDAANPFFKSKYATLDSIIKTIKKPLAENGLSFTQMPSGNKLVTLLMHASGEYIMSSYSMEPKERTPQAVGSTITYMRRYALAAVLGIATESDDDSNLASGLTENSKKGTPKKTKEEIESKPPFGEGSEIID